MRYTTWTRWTARTSPIAVLLFTAAGLGAQGGGERPTFRHETHRDVECVACHGAEQDESPEIAPSSGCERCHAPSDARTVALHVTRTLDIQLGSLDRPQRSLPFRHSSHDGIPCTACHTEGLALSAANVECTACHSAHHDAMVRCRECHEAPSPAAHDVQVHLGCGGSGCHEQAPQNIQLVPKTRELCLVCHDDMTYHKPGEDCASCHRLPPPREPGD